MNTAKNLWLILFFCLYACNSSLLKQPQPTEFKNVPKKVEVKKTSAIKPVYQGKYSDNQQLSEFCQKIPQWQKKIISTIAKRLGFVYSADEKISIVVRDWQKQDGKSAYRISKKIVDGNMQKQIELISEKIISGEFSPEFLLNQTYIEMILIDHEQLPKWIKQGAIYYGTADKKDVEQKLLARLLDDPRSLDELITGIESDSPSLELESYYAYIHFREVYEEKELMQFTFRVLQQKKDWEEELTNATKENYFSFQEKARLFTFNQIKEKYWSDIVSYRQAVKEYTDAKNEENIDKYLTALVKLDKLAEKQNSFMSGNLAFWLGMCYYRLGRYREAMQNFRRCFEQFPQQCIHLGTARYRYAACHYYQKLIGKAIIHYSDFIRDFPQHNFFDSAHYFLAECCRIQGKWRQAHHWYQKFYNEFPRHRRLGEALVKNSRVSYKLSWYGESRKLCLLALTNPLTAEYKVQCRQILQDIENAEKQGPDNELLEQLDNLAGNFAEKSSFEQQLALKELAYIGEIALPWLARLINDASPIITNKILDALEKIRSPGTASIYSAILKKKPEYSGKVLAGLVHSGIPPSLLENLVAQSVAHMNQKQKEQVLAQLENILWSTTPRLRDDFPDILKKLNGSSHQQMAVVEEMTLNANPEQIAVLRKLVMRGASRKVQLQALENLINWRRPENEDLFRRLFERKDYTFHIHAIRGLAQIKKYPLDLLKKTLQIPIKQARLITVDILAQAATSAHYRLLVTCLDDPFLEVRANTKQRLQEVDSEKIKGILLQMFLQEERKMHYYISLVELLEKIYQTAIFFRPDMNLQQRKKIVDHLKNFQTIR